MDYDDNDFQSQNLHLAGEGSAKVPPVLRPYALPKFDFDESIQGNLRFDSLVETEVFLGIESNEDNQWIDAFSRGGSGIEFSTAAAESCSISRHVNVWSEATSSESVEMLLKSVGQEDYIHRQTVTQESDACDELACLARQMDPNQKPDDNKEFKDDVTDLLPPSVLRDNLCGLKEGVGIEQSQAAVPQGHEVELSIDGSSGNLELNNVCRNIDLPASEGSLDPFTADKSNNTNQGEVETVADESNNDKNQDDPSLPGVKTNITEKSVQYVSDEQHCPLQTEIDKQDLESYMMNKDDVDAQTQDGNAVRGDAYHHDKPLCSIPIEVLETVSVVEGLKTGTDTSEESYGMEYDVNSDLQKAERCSEDTCFKDLSPDSASEDVILPKDEVDDPSALKSCDSPKVSINDDIVYNGQVVGDNNSNCGICPNLLQNVDVLEKIQGENSVIKENELLETSDHMNKETISSKSEASIFTAEENSISTISEGNSDNRQSSHKIFDQDVSINDQESTRIHSESNQIHCDVDQSPLVDMGAGSLSVAAGSVETELITSTVSINAATVYSSASQIILENSTLASSEIIDIPPPSMKDVSTHEITGHNDFQRINPVVCSFVDEKEESASKLAEKTSISIPLGSSDKETAPCPDIETEKRHSYDTSGQQLCETECTEEIGRSPVSRELTEKRSDGIAVSIIKNDKETLQVNHDQSSSKILGDDILLENKGSTSSAPLPYSSIELQEIGSFPVNNTSTPSSSFGSPSHIEVDENQVKASNQKPQVHEFIKSGTKNMLSTVQDPKENNTSKDERSLPPEVNPVADLSRKDVTDMNTEDVSKRQSVPVATANKESTAVEGTPSTSGPGPRKNISAGNISLGSPQISYREVTPFVSKATPERKTRRASNKTSGKESSRKGSRAKDTTPPNQSKRVDKSTNLSLSPSPGFQMVQSNDVQQYGHIDSNSSKPFVLVSAPTSSIPDLNTSASPPVLFHQPFMDLQQVQLRAQIFVYGALIQCIVPDEAHMISAFGGPDGGKSIWENVWRACVERHHSQRSHPTNPETPLQSRSGARTSDSAAKQSAIQGKATSSPLCQSSSKATPTFVNPLIPLSSPLWNLPTPSCDSLQSSAIGRGSGVDYPRARASLHTYQTPPLRNFLGHNTSWISQASIRGPWIPSPTPEPDNKPHISAPPVSDTIMLSSVKESSLPPSSGIKNVSPGLPTSSAGLQSITVGTASPLDANIMTVSHSQQSLDPKPRKRKRVVVYEDVGQKALQALTPVSNMSTSVVIVTPVRNVPIDTAEKSVVSVSPLDDHLKSDLNVEKKILSDDSLMKVKEARVHAEEASALSATAVHHSLEVWNQLDKHKSSGLTSVIEAKLASAAVAVAAAAAVARAAAAAANVASNAAIQAKLMAEEALISSGYENSGLSSKNSLYEGTSNFRKATPSSIFKGDNGTNSPGSIIGSAKEAVRRRMEAASAATKRAENMDAIVKAAELAAEAVSQAGKIVTMGDPLPLCDLVEAGPEGFWKAAQDSSHQVVLLNDITRDLLNISNVRDIPEASHTHVRDISSAVISTSVNINEKNFKGPKGHKISDLVKPVDMVPESEPEIQASLSIRNGSENPEETNIKEGSLVEVFKDEEGFNAAWFTANILTLKDGKAYVCYTSLLAVEDAGPLKEWVSLEGEVDKPPRIRTTRPLTSLHYEGTRKRRRAAMGDYVWSVGDRVDAWMQESWQEGVITEKNKKDETALTVHFPCSGETSVVRAWHLRPSLIWKDGKWIEFSKLGVNDTYTRQGDTPNEKRPKLGNPAVEVIGKDKMSTIVDAVESADPEERRLLNLTENDKVFNVGKSIKNDNKPDTHRLVRSGLQKEDSRVVFGVPKPGKKKKFMEVSKHYVAHGSSKTNDGNDSVKLANFLMPQGSGSRVWKNSSQNDSKEKPADFKPKPFKSGKPQSAVGRVIPPKDSSSNAFSLTTDLTGHTERIKDPSNHFKSAPQNESRQVGRAPYSATDGTTGRSILFSSRTTSTDALPPKRAPTSRANKGKLAPAGGKFGKGDAGKAINNTPIKSTSDVIEPRRSNRRIQPTSRLLEGLQSSLITSKIPSVSHNRNPSKGNNQG
ncbi:putative Agenet-like domain-containing protein [Lupinus albus]|uniref:Putative Agenet-like domain-containing protein n=1 Tax=Lupinus albus TaxID=3870 RepID=A0A6A4QGX1_LUPAL|nr:putative Agenet-like domain-containing protein [Lupinus albus]